MGSSQCMPLEPFLTISTDAPRRAASTAICMATWSAPMESAAESRGM